MKIIDISLPLQEGMVTWPGDPAVKIDWFLKIGADSDVNVSQFAMGAHTGTHIDAPLHYLANGASLDEIDLETLIGPAQVLDVPDSISLIDAAFLKGEEIHSQRLLFKTRNSRRAEITEGRKFVEDYVALSADGATYLLGLGVKLLGIDYLSIAPFADPGPTHHVLLGNGVIIIEGLNLEHVKAGYYDLICLPLRLSQREGAPARAVLVDKV